jgi:hypothetical protein
MVLDIQTIYGGMVKHGSDIIDFIIGPYLDMVRGPDKTNVSATFQVGET